MTDTLPVRDDRPAVHDTLLSIVYTSTAAMPFSEVDLALLLASSRANNEPHEVTGLLLYNEGRFLQALEGPERAVRATLTRITADPRHRDVRTLDEATIAERRFGSWAMGYRSFEPGDGDVPAWFGSPEAVDPREGSQSAALLSWFRAD